MRVIVTYPGFNAAVEEECYFATRRRPDQVGEQIISPKPDKPAEAIHNPEFAHQQMRFLSYTVANPAEAQALAGRLRRLPGLTDVTLVGLPERTEPAAAVARAATEDPRGAE